MKAEETTDLQLVDAIQKGGSSREKALILLYNRLGLRRKVCAYIASNGGNWQDGEDMYQEGIIVFDRNVRHGKFRGESTLEAYLFSICKFLWMNRRRKTEKMDLTDNTMEFEKGHDHTPEIDYINEEQNEILRTLIKGLGDRCQKVLKLWQLSYSMKEITEMVGLSSEGMARKTKYQCMKKLMEMVAGNANLKELFEND